MNKKLIISLNLKFKKLFNNLKISSKQIRQMITVLLIYVTNTFQSVLFTTTFTLDVDPSLTIVSSLYSSLLKNSIDLIFSKIIKMENLLVSR